MYGSHWGLVLVRLNNQFVGYDIKHAATTYLDVILTQYNQTIPYELSENLI